MSAFLKVEMMQNFEVISNKFNLESVFDKFTAGPCAMLCNIKPETIQFITKLITASKVLVVPDLFLHIL
jgi:hypothetical protein